MNIFNVELTKEAKKGLQKAPEYIKTKLALWAKNISNFGLLEVRKISGYHDEPLKGKRKGQRSIRLSKHYRAIYLIDGDKSVVLILEVNKHEY